MPNRPALLAAALLPVLAAEAAAESPRQLMRQFDANRDGALQFSEIRQMRAQIFARADADGDGVLWPSEMEAAAQAAATRRGRSFAGGSDRLEMMDGNGDGVLDQAEFVGYLPPRLASADRDGDGALSRRELRSLRR